MDDSTSEEHVDVKTGSVGRWARIPKSTTLQYRQQFSYDLTDTDPKKDRLVRFLADSWTRRADFLPVALPHYATLWFLSCSV